jgi:acetyltransferase-like isoleucine patch superfamily enzyme
MSTATSFPDVKYDCHLTAQVSERIRIRGRGHISIAEFATIEDDVTIDLGSSGHGYVRIASRAKLKIGVVLRCYGGAISIGHRTTIGEYCVVFAHGGVEVGAHVGIGPHTTIAASQHITEALDIPMRYQGETAAGVLIEDDVWIGSGVRVLDGVTIGHGSVVGAGSVVTRRMPARFVCHGVPCRPVRRR